MEKAGEWYTERMGVGAFFSVSIEGFQSGCLLLVTDIVSLDY